jgi:hypothetical protein
MKEKEVRKLHNTIAEQNVVIDTLRTTLSRAGQVIKDETDKEYVFTRASKWAMTADINNL